MKCGVSDSRNDSLFKRQPVYEMRSGDDTEGAIDELRLANNVRLRQPADLPLTNNVHGFVSCDCPRCTVNGSEPLTAQHALFHEAMIPAPECCLGKVLGDIDNSGPNRPIA
jgi:hypothetical protein